MGNGPISEAPPSAAAPGDEVLYHLGKSYFDVREYLRCYHALRDSMDPRCHFLASYALYMGGELRKQEGAWSSFSTGGTCVLF